MTRAQLDKRPSDVSAMFDKVAQRYDLLNDVLSLGQDRWWRKVVARAVGAQAGERILDLAAGTGTSSVGFTGPRGAPEPPRCPSPPPGRPASRATSRSACSERECAGSGRNRQGPAPEWPGP